MRKEQLAELVRLAMVLQGKAEGLTLGDIRQEFEVSRRTAERMRDAVEWAFGPLDILDVGDRKRHWRLRSPALRGLIGVSPREIAEIEAAAESMDAAGFGERAAALRGVARKLRALSRRAPDELDAAIEAAMRAEGLAMRPGPRQALEEGLLAKLREAIAKRRTVSFEYRARDRAPTGRRRVHPYGVLYGNRAFLVGPVENLDHPVMWRLTGMSGLRVELEGFQRNPGFDLRRYAEQSFGAFHGDDSIDVVLRFDAEAAADAGAFLFHPQQTVEENSDGSLTVRFTACGAREMCWHLVTWYKSVTVESPDGLRRDLAALCRQLADHHGAAPRDPAAIRETAAEMARAREGPTPASAEKVRAMMDE